MGETTGSRNRLLTQRKDGRLGGVLDHCQATYGTVAKMDIGAVMLQLVSVFAGSNPACSTSPGRGYLIWGAGVAALLPFPKGKYR